MWKKRALEKYDHMIDFWKRFFPFLFQQTPALVFMSAVVYLMWGKMERMETAFNYKIERNNMEWKVALDLSRAETRICDEKRVELALELAQLKAEFAQVKKYKLSLKK